MQRDSSKEHVEPLDRSFTHALSRPWAMVIQLPDTNTAVGAMGRVQRSTNFTLSTDNARLDVSLQLVRHFQVLENYSRVAARHHREGGRRKADRQDKSHLKTVQ